MLDNVGRRKSTKDVDLTVTPGYLGTMFEIAFDIWKHTPAIDLNYSLAYQVAQPAQLPFDLGNENDGKEWHTDKVNYKLGEVHFVGKKQLLSGVPTLMKTVDPTEFRPDGRNANTRHLAFMVATIIDMPKTTRRQVVAAGRKTGGSGHRGFNFLWK